MSYFKGMLRTSGQKSGQEEEAIQTLGNRLQHATLAADRKSAVLGLKSFSRQFRECVVQYGLRALLQTLAKDAENAQMVKAILETLLGLYLRSSGPGTDDAEPQGWISSQSRAQNGKYPSPLLATLATDEFSQWIADEVLSGPEHVQSLVKILHEHSGFQLRLYALQVLEAVVATRPVRAKETLLNIPLAVSTIVGVLDDANDPVRNEAILLLMALVNHNYNIQKLVAFENTFTRIFAIIEEEGGIRGSIVVQDCMTLLTNLLMYNASNQTFFLETDCVPKLAQLIAEPLDTGGADPNDPVLAPPIVWTGQRLQNMAILLDICRSFVDPENQHLVSNQAKLHSSGIFLSILRIVFSPVMENPIRRAALQATGDIIANNAELQLQFAHIDVPYVDPSVPLQVQKYSEAVPAPLALLNWALLTNSVHIFEVRLAAMSCLAKFFSGNTDAKTAFLSDQISASRNPNFYTESKQSELASEDGPGSEAEAAKPQANPGTEKGNSQAPVLDDAHKTPYANIFTTLTVFDFDVKLNPYSVWFSAITLVYLISDCPETRNMAREMKVGSAEDGEEEMSSIQAIAGMLIANLENSDPRIAVGYLVLLTLWLYEDFDAVNEFLSDASIIKTIVGFLSKNSSESSEIVQGMGSVLVGVCYDFCTKTAPFPRESLYELVSKSLGAHSYALKVKQFKNNPLLKQFDGDLESEFERDASGLPELFFISEYVELVKDNYYRIRKSLSRGPHFEPRSRISFEIFEEMENKNVELKQTLEDLNVQADENEKSLKSQVEACEAELKSKSDVLDLRNNELQLLKIEKQSLNEKSQALSENVKALEADKKKYMSSSEHYTAEFHKLSKKTTQDEGHIKQLKLKLADTEALKQKAEDGINKMSRELFQLTKQQREAEAKIASLEKEISKMATHHEKALKELQLKIDGMKATNEELQRKISALGKQELDTASPSSEETKRALQDLQARVRDMEEANDNLMEKLRSAASVVSGLRSDKAMLEKSKESLEIELAKAYEDLEALSHLMEEIEELKEDHQSLDRELTDSKITEPTIEEIGVIKEEKNQLEARLAQSAQTIECLQAALIETKAKLDTLSEANGNAIGERSTHTAIDSSPFREEINQRGKESQTDSAVQTKSADEIQKLDEELAKLRSSLQLSEDSRNLESSNHSKEIEELRLEQQKMLDEHESLKKQIEQSTGSAKGDSDGLNQKNESPETTQKRDQELEISSRRIKELEKNIEMLSESASSSLASFKDSQDTLKARIDQLEEGRKTMSVEIDEFEQERKKMISDFQEAYDELDSAYMDLELSQSNLEKHKDDLEKQLNKLQKDSSVKIEKLTTESENLTKDLQDARTERDNIRREYYELEKSTNIIGSELQAKEALLQAISNKGADLAAKDKIVIEIKEKLAKTIEDLGASAQKIRVLNEDKAALQKTNEDIAAQLQKSTIKISDLENEIHNGTESLEKSIDENKKLVSVQKNYFEASKANDEHLAKIESLEKEVSDLKCNLSSVNEALDEQRKLNCENSSTAALTLTEKSAKLEKSIIEKQESHDRELRQVREAAERQVQKLNNELVSLEENNKNLQENLALSDRSKADNDATNIEIENYISRINSMQAELVQATSLIESLQRKMEEKNSEVESNEEKLEALEALVRSQEVESGESLSHSSELKKELESMKMNALEQENTIRELQKAKSELTQALEFSTNHAVVDSNGTEKQETDDTMEAHLDHSSTLTDPKIHRSDEDLSAAQKHQAALEENLSKRNAELAELTDELDQARLLIKTLETEISSTETPHIQKNAYTSAGVEDLQLNELPEQECVSEKNVEGIFVNGKHAGENGEKGESGDNYSTSNDELKMPKNQSEDQSTKLLAEIESLREKSSHNEAANSKRIEEIETSLEEKMRELSKANQEIEEQRRELKIAEEKVKESQEESHLKTETNEKTLQAQLKGSEELLAQKNREISELQKTMEALNDNQSKTDEEAPVLDSIPNDFEDLLLLCDHQEQKIEKYKRKLRALDIEISSDESDGEDLL